MSKITFFVLGGIFIVSQCDSIALAKDEQSIKKRSLSDSSQSPTSEFECDGLIDGYYYDLKYHCEIFYYCLNSYLYKYKCEEGKQFDDVTKTCQLQASNKCKSNSRKKKAQTLQSEKLFSISNNDPIKDSGTTSVLKSTTDRNENLQPLSAFALLSNNSSRGKDSSIETEESHNYKQFLPQSFPQVNNRGQNYAILQHPTYTPRPLFNPLLDHSFKGNDNIAQNFDTSGNYRTRKNYLTSHVPNLNGEQILYHPSMQLSPLSFSYSSIHSQRNFNNIPNTPSLFDYEYDREKYYQNEKFEPEIHSGRANQLKVNSLSSQDISVPLGKKLHPNTPSELRDTQNSRNKKYKPPSIFSNENTSKGKFVSPVDTKISRDRNIYSSLPSLDVDGGSINTPNSNTLYYETYSPVIESNEPQNKIPYDYQQNDYPSSNYYDTTPTTNNRRDKKYGHPSSFIRTVPEIEPLDQLYDTESFEPEVSSYDDEDTISMNEENIRKFVSNDNPQYNNFNKGLHTVQDRRETNAENSNENKNYFRSVSKTHLDDSHQEPPSKNINNQKNIEKFNSNAPKNILLRRNRVKKIKNPVSSPQKKISEQTEKDDVNITGTERDLEGKNVNNAPADAHVDDVLSNNKVEIVNKHVFPPKSKPPRSRAEPNLLSKNLKQRLARLGTRRLRNRGRNKNNARANHPSVVKKEQSKAEIKSINISVDPSEGDDELSSKRADIVKNQKANENENSEHQNSGIFEKNYFEIPNTNKESKTKSFEDISLRVKEQNATTNSHKTKNKRPINNNVRLKFKEYLQRRRKFLKNNNPQNKGKLPRTVIRRESSSLETKNSNKKEDDSEISESIGRVRHKERRRRKIRKKSMRQSVPLIREEIIVPLSQKEEISYKSPAMKRGLQFDQAPVTKEHSEISVEKAFRYTVRPRRIYRKRNKPEVKQVKVKAISKNGKNNIYETLGVPPSSKSPVNTIVIPTNFKQIVRMYPRTPLEEFVQKNPKFNQAYEQLPKNDDNKLKFNVNIPGEFASTSDGILASQFEYANDNRKTSVKGIGKYMRSKEDAAIKDTNEREATKVEESSYQPNRETKFISLVADDGKSDHHIEDEKAKEAKVIAPITMVTEDPILPIERLLGFH